MDTSDLVDKLRIIGMAVGFLWFVVMAAHWVVGVSQADPVLNRPIIAWASGEHLALKQVGNVMLASELMTLTESSRSSMAAVGTVSSAVHEGDVDDHTKIEPAGQNIADMVVATATDIVSHKQSSNANPAATQKIDNNPKPHDIDN